MNRRPLQVSADQAFNGGNWVNWGIVLGYMPNVFGSRSGESFTA